MRRWILAFAALLFLVVGPRSLTAGEDSPATGASVRLNFATSAEVAFELRKLFSVNFVESDSMTISYEADSETDQKIMDEIRKLDVEPRRTLRFSHENSAEVAEMLRARFENISVALLGDSSLIVTALVSDVAAISEAVEKFMIPPRIPAAEKADSQAAASARAVADTALVKTAPLSAAVRAETAAVAKADTSAITIARSAAPTETTTAKSAAADTSPGPSVTPRPAAAPVVAATAPRTDTRPVAAKTPTAPARPPLPELPKDHVWVILKQADAKEMQSALESLMKEKTRIATDRNAIGVPMSSANLAGIMDEIAAWDTSGIATRRFPIRYLDAKDMLTVIKDRVKITGSVVDAVNNSVILSGPSSLLLSAFSIIRSLDVAMPSYRDAVASKDNQVSSRVYQLSHVGAADIANIVKSSYTSLNKENSADIDPRRNRIVITATEHVHEKIRDLITQYDVPDLSGGKTVGTSAIPVYYRSLAEAAKIIEEHFKPITVSIDNNSKKLIVSGSNDKIESIKSFAHMWDKKPPTILVEGTILQVNHNKINEVGAKLEHTFARTDVKANDRTMTTGTTATSNFTTTSLQSIVYEWQSPDGRLYRATLGALISEGAIDISVKPHITFISGGTGSFEQKQKIPQVTSSDKGTNVNFSSAGLALSVGGIAVPLRTDVPDEETPYQIVLSELRLEDGRVGAQVAATNAVAFFSNEVIFKSPQIVNDGELIIVGGSMERNITKTLSRVPILGSIPILRILFRYNKDDERILETMALLRISVVREKSYEYKAAQFTASRPLRPIEFGGGIKDSISEHPLKTSTWSSEIIYKDGGGYFEWLHHRFDYDQMKSIEREFKSKIRGRIHLTQEWDDMNLVRKLILTDKGLAEAFVAISEAHEITPYELLIIARHIGSIDDPVFLIYKEFLEKNQLLIMAHKQATKPLPLNTPSK